MPYKLTRRAAADLRRIYLESVRDFGVEQAETYKAGLRRSLDLIGANPKLGREQSEISPPVRIHPSGVHVIVYLIAAEDDVVVVRFRHGREDWMADPL